MDLNDILANIEDQERGREFELRHPVSGAPTGIKFRIAGPDSRTANRARIAMVDELAEIARPDGTVSAHDRQHVRINALARVVLGWNLTEGGEPLPFTHRNVVRVLTNVPWIHEQVDAFADDRSTFRESA